MNETIKTILERRSVRRFKPEQISRADIETAVDCGLHAPSAMNTQNWHFSVVRNRDLIDELNAKTKAALSPAFRERMLERYNGDEDFSVFYGAPTVVIVAGDGGDGYADANCALAAENICLAAQSLGISSCIIGMAALMFSAPDAGEYCSRLKIPAGYKVRYAIALGYPAMEPQKPERITGRADYFE